MGVVGEYEETAHMCKTIGWEFAHIFTTCVSLMAPNYKAGNAAPYSLPN